MLRSFDDIVAHVRLASRPAQIFDGVDDSATYRDLAKILHPDLAPDDKKADATEAFAKLSQLWNDHNGISTATTSIHTKKQTYTILNRLAVGNICNVYLAENSDGLCVMKFPKAPRDNDLMEREAKSLKALDGADEDTKAFTPTLLDSFRHKDANTHEERRVNVLNYLEGFYSLSHVKDCYPDGLDPRDVAWMWRRGLVAIASANQVGIVHGALTPDNILIHPEMHGVVACDWCYSIGDPAERIPALVPERKAWYPPEVLAKEAVDVSTDIWMLTETMMWLMGDKSIAPFRAFRNGCNFTNVKVRPHDPWKLLAEFDELLERCFGPRKFRPFTLPTLTK